MYSVKITGSPKKEKSPRGKEVGILLEILTAKVGGYLRSGHVTSVYLIPRLYADTAFTGAF